jgi:hypothetical protein
VDIRYTYVAQTDILDEGGIDLGSGQSFLQQSVDHVVQLGILETTLAGLGQRCAQGQSDDHIIGILLGAI